jgi:glycosidase
VYDAVPANQFATFITNHDQNRVMSQLDGDIDKAKLAASILLTSPGIPFVYYGEEIGMVGSKPDEDIRRPMQWTSQAGAGFTTGSAWRAPADDYKSVNIAAQDADPNSLLNHYRALIALRNSHEALRIGDWTLIESNSGRIYAFLRQTDDQSILVIINLSRQAVNADQYALELTSSTLRGELTAISLHGLPEPLPPRVDAQGGFSSFVPFAEIAPRTTHIIQLTNR